MASVNNGPVDARTHRVLVIDDNQAIHDDFRKILCDHAGKDGLDDVAAAFLGEQAKPKASSAYQFEMSSAFQGQEGFEQIVEAREKGDPFAVAYVDMRMPPGWDGVKTIEKIFESDDQIQIVICSAYSDYTWDDLLDRFGVTDRLLILRKPFDTAEVLQITCALAQKYELGIKARLKMGQLQELVDQRTNELMTESDRRQQAVEALAFSEKRFRSAFEDAGVGMAMIGSDGAVLRANQAMGKMLKLDPQALVDMKLDQLIDPSVLTEDQATRTRFMESVEQACHYETRYIDKDQNTVWVDLTLSKIGSLGDAESTSEDAYDLMPDDCELLAQVQDITDRKVAEQKLRHEALHDALTGLANRALFTQRLDQALERSRRDPGYQSAVMFVDLDRFKIINDSLGHLVGDELLIGVTERIGKCLRRVDTISAYRDQTLARLGGDEFVILLECIQDAESAVAIADRIQAVLCEVFEIQGFEVFVSASIGINMVSPQYANTDEVLRDADTALYRAKGAGRAQACLFDTAMHEKAKKRLDTEVNLRHAIDRGEFILVYQPIVDVMTRKLSGFEALLRWVRPDGATVMPADFIHVAEETGQIVRIGTWALQEACQQAKLWCDQISGGQDICINVNMSGLQLTREDLPDAVHDAINRSGCNPKSINLEVTESVIGDSNEMAFQRLHDLRQMGIGIHLDDFGTGYSSMAYLRTLPVDAIKIDQSFVERLPVCNQDQAIVEAVTTLAHKLDLKVVAEGIETPQQLAQVERIGCNYLQGYYFSRPLSIEDATELLAKQCVWTDDVLMQQYNETGPGRLLA